MATITIDLEVGETVMLTVSAHHETADEPEPGDEAEEDDAPVLKGPWREKQASEV